MNGNETRRDPNRDRREIKKKKDRRLNPGTIATNVASSLIEDAARSAIKSIGTILLNSLSNQIIIYDNMYMYSEVNLLLYEMNPEKYMANMIPDRSTNKELSEGARYFIKCDSKNFMSVHSIVNKDKNYDSRKVIITFYGPSRRHYRAQFIAKAMNFVPKGCVNISNVGYWGYQNTIPTHSFDHIVMDNASKKRIIEGLINWKNSKDWYEKHYLVHKIGLLLYGDPGTGKSSIVRAIAAMFNASIHTVDAKSLSQRSPIEVLNRLRSKDGINILLFEDLDLLLGKVNPRKELDIGTGVNPVVNSTDDGIPKDEGADAEHMMNIFFQILDGVYSAPNTIYIATTNCIEKLDKALIRPGRFDIQEELKYFEKDKALEYIKLMGYNEGVLDILMSDETYPIQPAKLQSMVMGYRSTLNGK